MRTPSSSLHSLKHWVSLVEHLAWLSYYIRTWFHFQVLSTTRPYLLLLSIALGHWSSWPVATNYSQASDSRELTCQLETSGSRIVPYPGAVPRPNLSLWVVSLVAYLYLFQTLRTSCWECIVTRTCRGIVLTSYRGTTRVGISFLGVII